jgi:hypothetical protein
VTKTLEPAYAFFYEPKSLKVKLGLSADVGLARIGAFSSQELNPEQASAIHGSFGRRVSLLWGPPGTGKTWTLAMLIVAWIEAARAANRAVVIAVGASNYNAIDNVLVEVAQLQKLQPRGKKLRKAENAAPIYRLRSDFSEPLDVEGVLDIARGEADCMLDVWAKPKECVVVGSTFQQLVKLTSKWSGTGKPGFALFDLIVLDEASQVSTINAMAYATAAKPDAHLVVCGDDRQLGPVRHFYVQNTREGLLESAFQFFKSSHQLELVALRQNYRSNEVITGWPANRFYDGFEAVRKKHRLEYTTDGKPPQGWPAALPWSDAYDFLLDPAYPVCVVTYQDRTATVSNQFEALLAAGLVRTYYLRSKAANPGLSRTHFWQDKAGLVTPHRAQIATIRNLLGPDFMPEEGGLSFVDTVDRFQGQERDLIIASYTVADPDFIATEEDFILDPRRFNVTMTRARSKFILLVSQTLMGYLPADREVAIDAAHLQLLTRSYCHDTPVALSVPGKTAAKDCLVYRRTFDA